MTPDPKNLARAWLPAALERSSRMGLTTSEGGWLIFALVVAFFAPNFLRGSLKWCPERAAAMGILLALPIGLLPPFLALEARALRMIRLALEALRMNDLSRSRRRPSRLDPCKGVPGREIAREAARLSPEEREALVREAAAGLEPLLAEAGVLQVLLVLGPLLPGFVLLLMRTPDLTTWVVLVAGIALSFHGLLKLQSRAARRSALVRELACLAAAALSGKEDLQGAGSGGPK